MSSFVSGIGRSFITSHNDSISLTRREDLQEGWQTATALTLRLFSNFGVQKTACVAVQEIC